MISANRLPSRNHIPYPADDSGWRPTINSYGRAALIGGNCCSPGRHCRVRSGPARSTRRAATVNGQVSKSTQKGKGLSGNLLRTGTAAKPAPTRPAKTSRTASALGPSGGASWPELQPYGYALPLALQFQFQQSEWWPAERLAAQQLRQIHRLIKHAAATVPYHRDRLADLAAVPLGELTFNAFRRAPIMTRSDIQQAGGALISRSVPPHHGYVGLVRSSGSTGRPIEVATTELVAAFGLAMTMRDHLWQHDR